MKTLIFTAATAAVLGGASLVAAPPAATGTGWDLVFADEFSGTSLDTMKGWIDQSYRAVAPKTLVKLLS